MNTSRFTSLAAIAAAALALTACGSTVDTADLEAKIKSELEANVGEGIESIDCPDEIAAEEGTEFDCTLTAEDGSTAKVEGRMVDDEGNFEAEVVEG